ncbi:MAG: hypothetical protein ABI566_07180 [Pseudolysinimonas sp.]
MIVPPAAKPALPSVLLPDDRRPRKRESESPVLMIVAAAAGLAAFSMAILLAVSGVMF